MDLTFEEERLTRQFAGSFSAQQVAQCLEETATGLARTAHILSYIPVLAEHATRDRLRARLP
jgi:Protein-tyrosine-phosphatase-like, N-terminal domain